MYLNSAEVVAFAIQTGILHDRLDLVSLYYPYPAWVPPPLSTFLLSFPRIRYLIISFS